MVRNFVPVLPEPAPGLSLPEWNAPLFFYFGRIDENKNFSEFVKGLSLLRTRLDQQPLGLVFGPVVPGFPLAEVIRSNHAEGFVVMFPPVPFEHSHILMQLLQRRRAIFVSCSKGESFGLSAAEAMSTGLPVILSDIPPHAALAGRSDALLYPLADLACLANRMASAITNYDALSAKSLELARHFSEQAFLDDWRRVAATCPAGIV